MHTDPSTINWAQIDWVNNNDAALVRRTGVALQNIRRARRYLGAPRAKTWHKHENGSKTIDGIRRNWDWSMKDVDLAKVHNLTRERIRQIRKALGLPSSRLLHNAGRYSKRI